MIKKTKIILLSTGIVLGIMSIVFVKTNKSSVVQQLTEKTVDDDFAPEHFNILRVDSFSKIVQEAYLSAVVLTRKEAELLLIFKSDNLKEVYNHNEALLKEKRKGFKIKEGDGNLSITFLIKNESISVPNDLLLPIAKRIHRK